MRIIKIFSILLSIFLIPASSFSRNWDDSVIGTRDPYFKVLKKNTHKGTGLALSYLDTRFIWYATHKSETFREAFLKFYQKNYPEGQEGLAKKLAQTWITPNTQTEFFIALYARDTQLEILGGAQSLWDLSLLVGEQLYKPLTVEPLELTPFEVRFFPYIDRWYQIYRVTFPQDSAISGGNPFSLLLTSVAGKSELKFK